MNEFEWDGTEECLMNLLIWWAQVAPGEPVSSEIQLICGDLNRPEESNWYGLAATAEMAKQGEPLNVLFCDNRADAETMMSPGDKIVYHGEWVFELVKALQK